MRVQITTKHPQSSYGIPVCLIDGDLVDDREGFKAACEQLGWCREKTAEMTGKSLGVIDSYRNGRQPVPAEVWNVLRDNL